MTKLVRNSIIVIVIAVLSALLQAPNTANARESRNTEVGSYQSVGSTERLDLNSARANWKCGKWSKENPLMAYMRTCVKLTHITTKWVQNYADGVDNRGGGGTAHLTCITESTKTWEFGVKVGASVGSRPANSQNRVVRANAFRGLRGLSFVSLNLSVEGSVLYKTTSVRRSQVEWDVPAGKYLRCLRGVWKHPFKGIAISQMRTSSGRISTLKKNYISGAGPEPTIWRKKWVL